MVRYSDGRPNPVWAVVETKSPQHAPIKSYFSTFSKNKMTFMGRSPETYLRPG